MKVLTSCKSSFHEYRYWGKNATIKVSLSIFSAIASHLHC